MSLGSRVSGSWRTPQGTIHRTVPDRIRLALLRSESLVERRLHGSHSTPQTLRVKGAGMVARAEQLVRDVERRHDRDALGARHPARILDFGHFAVQIGYRGQQGVPLLVR